MNKMRERTSACESKLDPLLTSKAKDGDDKTAKTNGAQEEVKELGSEARPVLQQVLKDLDGITEEMNELEKYSRINYTAVIKATKKHDKLRGRSYRLRPFINARLTEKPIYTEDHSPLLYRLSAMYSFVRQSLDGKPQEALSFAENATSAEEFTSHKCTSYLPHLPSEANKSQSGYTRTICSKSRL